MNEERKNTASNVAFDSFLCYAQQANTVPREVFENFRVKRGLREKDGTGVMAGVTNIGNAHGYMIYEGERIADDGKLEYRGFDMSAIVDGVSAENRYGFEECAYILLFGRLPSKAELDECIGKEIILNVAQKNESKGLNS
jgi:citrate synthase